MSHRGQIGEVVAHHRDLGGLQPEPLAERGQRAALVAHALVHLGDAELGHAPGHRGGGPRGEHRDLQPRLPRGDQGQAVVDVEALGFLAGGAVEEPAVGQHPVDIEDEEADAGSAGSGGHTILASRMSCSRITPAGRPAASAITRLVMRPSIRASARVASSSAPITFGSRVMHSPARRPSRAVPWATCWRRRPPSVRIPTRPPRSSTMLLIPNPLPVISSMASFIVACYETIVS